MTIESTGSPHDFARRKRSRGLEYSVYFSLILALALPVALLQWVAALVRPAPLVAERGVLRHAWCTAAEITPRIFSA